MGAVGAKWSRRDSMRALGALAICVVGIALLSWISSQKPVAEVNGTWFDAEGAVAVSPGTYDAVKAFGWIAVIVGIVAVIVVIVRRGGHPFASPARPPSAVAVSRTPRGPQSSSRLPPPGWLPDPDDAMLERWWAGAQWGAQTRGRTDA